MPVFELFSERQRNMRNEISDVYQYEDIGQKFRKQVILIVIGTMGIENQYHECLSTEFYLKIHHILCKEYGEFTLAEDEQLNCNAIFSFFLNSHSYKECLDIIELIFKYIDTVFREKIENYTDEYLYTVYGITQNPDDAISELNSRFKKSAIGYQFQSRKLIKIDSTFIHSEVVKPVLSLLESDNKYYQGANAEFLKAYDHYKYKQYKECFVECLKSLESLMKSICEKHSWSYDKKNAAQQLINICLKNDLIPEYLNSHFFSTTKFIGSGITTIRNQKGAHGQGTQVTDVPEYLVSYTLHLTATNLLFLINCEKAMFQREADK